MLKVPKDWLGFFASQSCGFARPWGPNDGQFDVQVLPPVDALLFSKTENSTR